MRREELRVKVRSLAEEARIIRHEERRALGKERWASRHGKSSDGTYARLRGHRVHVVRPEARATQLAVAYLRGKPYAEVEGPTSSTPDWSRVGRLVLKYGPWVPQRQASGIVETLQRWALGGGMFTIAASGDFPDIATAVCDAAVAGADG